MYNCSWDDPLFSRRWNSGILRPGTQYLISVRLTVTPQSPAWTLIPLVAGVWQVAAMDPLKSGIITMVIASWHWRIVSKCAARVDDKGAQCDSCHQDSDARIVSYVCFKRPNLKVHLSARCAELQRRCVQQTKLERNRYINRQETTTPLTKAQNPRFL